jgi:nascent polypeptide-associated complex subunit alpha
MIFAITNPEVYKLGNDYIVFGEAKMEDPALQAQALAAQRMAANRQHQSAAPKVQEVEEDAGEDASGVEEKDIKIVMEQANVTRTKAIQTLKAHNNDIVNAIMELSL